MDELLPCPFCGKRVVIESKGLHGYDLHIYIQCCSVMFGVYGKELCLITKWNNRI